MTQPVDPAYAKADSNAVIEINTINEFGLSIRGDKTVTTSWGTPAFRDKQACYRFIAWLECMAEMLPDANPAHSLEDIRRAIRNT